MSECHACGREVDPGDAFCAFCGAAAEAASPSSSGCPACGKPIKLGVRFCPSCGHRLGEEAPPPVAQRPDPVPPVTRAPDGEWSARQRTGDTGEIALAPPERSAPEPYARQASAAARESIVIPVAGGVFVAVGSALPWLRVTSLRASAWRLPLAGLITGGRLGAGVAMGVLLIPALVLLVTMALTRRRANPGWLLAAGLLASLAVVLTFARSFTYAGFRPGLGLLVSGIGAFILILGALAGSGR